jgi:hypothetical protein
MTPRERTRQLLQDLGSRLRQIRLGRQVPITQLNLHPVIVHRAERGEGGLGNIVAVADQLDLDVDVRLIERGQE